MDKKYQDLLSPYTFSKGIELKNRIIMAPMTNFSSNPDGTVTDAEVDYYARRSKGVSMVITACTYVTPNGKGFHGEFGGDSDEMIPSLKKLAKGIKDQGAKAVLQIFHGGRMCPPELVPNGEIVSASDIPAERGGVSTEEPEVKPRALTESEVEEMIHAFGETTRRAIEVGFDGVEIHGANGYLIQQFFSPHSNRREDQFGGSLEKRLTFPLAVVDAVKNAVEKHAESPFIIGYRFSPEEPETPGLTMEDTLVLVDTLADKGLDYLHVSLTEFFSKPRRGVADLNKTRIEYLLETINNRVPLIGVGSIYTAEDAHKAFAAGVPLLALGRELIIDPDWVQKVAEGKDDEIITKLNKDKQEQLVIPDPLWNVIINTPGWFPGV
ncbi:NADH-dependent flavin oxidoreductase [Metabacillus fastidiosus]|uniref:NADH-dependent flavin oxidoreductase n=1 Tax=Metabacillus fastidiosus TaxID=1458 RepID=UPI000824CDD0|nr:NADH-dependent flavin oxidoreductase [Metabacillus fastidiosus]MED4462053.1 NADH-dependent flavin oxidoreductase [Metabacillus fastidiosus]